MSWKTLLAVPPVVALAAATDARADAFVDASASAMLSIPSISAQQTTRVTSGGMIAGGVVLSVLGLAGTVLGVVALVVQCTGQQCGSNEVIGGVSLGLSLATEVTGIVLISVGATPRRVVTQNEHDRTIVARPEPEVFRLSLRGLGLRMAF